MQRLVRRFIDPSLFQLSADRHLRVAECYLLAEPQSRRDYVEGARAIDVRRED